MMICNFLPAAGVVWRPDVTCVDGRFQDVSKSGLPIGRPHIPLSTAPPPKPERHLLAARASAGALHSSSTVLLRLQLPLGESKL
jgi:hypothetical protein